MREGQRMPREVQGKSQETQEITQEYKETCRNLAKMFRQAIPSKTKLKSQETKTNLQNQTLKRPTKPRKCFRQAIHV
jgi:hypothetical protein